jgi:hypothetical protein
VISSSTSLRRSSNSLATSVITAGGEHVTLLIVHDGAADPVDEAGRTGRSVE